MIKLPKEIRSYKNFHYVNDKLKESNKYAPEVNNKSYLLDIMLDNLTPKQQEYIQPIRHLLSKGQGFVCSARDNTAVGSINYDGITLYTRIYRDPETSKTRMVLAGWHSLVEFIILFDVEKDIIESTFTDAVNPFKPTEEECIMFHLQHGVELNLYNYQEVKRTELQKSYEE